MSKNIDENEIIIAPIKENKKLPFGVVSFDDVEEVEIETMDEKDDEDVSD